MHDVSTMESDEKLICFILISIMVFVAMPLMVHSIERAVWLPCDEPLTPLPDYLIPIDDAILKYSGLFAGAYITFILLLILGIIFIHGMRCEGV